MEKKNWLLDFFMQVFLIFGIAITLLSILCLIFGDKMQNASTLFVMGNKGLSIETIFQLLLASFCVTLLTKLVISDFIKNNLSKTSRLTIFISLISGVSIIFIHLFRWFPRGVVHVWLIFAICVLIASVTSIYISFKQESVQNKNMAKALDKLKDELNRN